MVMRAITVLSLLALAGCEGAAGVQCVGGRVITQGGVCKFVDAATFDGQVPSDAGADASVCGACSEVRPLCRESDMMCVECLGDGDCGGGRCDTEAGACVGCLGDADCTDASEPICMGGDCTACTTDAQCRARNADAAVCEGGSCLECTPMKRDACEGFICDGATNTCSTTRMEESKGLCQECIADAECQEGQLCVPMTFEGTDVGNFCLWRQDATFGPNGSCSNVPPYFDTIEEVSIDDTTQMVCSLRRTTCVALNQFSEQSCTVGTPPVSATNHECGIADLDDGLCRVVAAGDNRCTIPCSSDEDCPGVTCLTTESPRYCDL